MKCKSFAWLGRRWLVLEGGFAILFRHVSNHTNYIFDGSGEAEKRRAWLPSAEAGRSALKILEGSRQKGSAHG